MALPCRVELTALGRRPVRPPPSAFAISPLRIQVGEELLDDLCVLNPRDEPDRGRMIEDDAPWDVVTYDRLSTWGHKPPAVLVDALANSSRIQPVTNPGPTP